MSELFFVPMRLLLRHGLTTFIHQVEREELQCGMTHSHHPRRRLVYLSSTLVRPTFSYNRTENHRSFSLQSRSEGTDEGDLISVAWPDLVFVPITGEVSSIMYTLVVCRRSCPYTTTLAPSP